MTIGSGDHLIILNLIQFCHRRYRRWLNALAIWSISR